MGWVVLGFGCWVCCDVVLWLVLRLSISICKQLLLYVGCLFVGCLLFVSWMFLCLDWWCVWFWLWFCWFLFLVLCCYLLLQGLVVDVVCWVWGWLFGFVVVCCLC